MRTVRMRIIARKTEIDRFLTGRKLALGDAEKVARPILAAVRKNGDRALAAYSRRFDKYTGPLRIGAAELQSAWKSTDPALRRAMRAAHKNIERFAGMQM